MAVMQQNAPPGGDYFSSVGVASAPFVASVVSLETSGASSETSGEAAGAFEDEATVALFALKVRREIFLEALFFGMTPLEAALASVDVASLKVALIVSCSFSEIAAATFLSAVFTFEFIARFRMRRFSDCRCLFSADG